MYNVGFSTFFPHRNQNGYNFNPSPVHKLFLYSQTKMQQHFLGVCFKTNSQYIPSLVSPLTSLKKKRKRKQNRKRKKYIQEPILFRYSRRCVYTRNFSPGFVCYEICMPQYQMWPGSNARRMQQVFDPRPRQHWVSIIAQLQQKIFSLRIYTSMEANRYIYIRASRFVGPKSKQRGLQYH